MTEEEYDQYYTQNEYKYNAELITFSEYKKEKTKLDIYYKEHLCSKDSYPKRKRRKKPLKDVVFSFGKYKGHKYPDVKATDPDYINWLKKNRIPIR